MGKRNTYTDDQLRLGSQYLRYHVRMYSETLNWILNQTFPDGWNTVGNAILEDHLIHTRILIDFLRKDEQHSQMDDILAIDYFHDSQEIYQPLDDLFLIQQAKKFGGYQFHITTKPFPRFRSKQDWEIGRIANILIPELQKFFLLVPNCRLAESVKSDCISFITGFMPPPINFSTSVTT